MPDWEELRQEYITGDIGLRTLAAKYDVSFYTLKDHAKREAWGDGRREYRKAMGLPVDTPHPTPHHTPQQRQCGVQKKEDLPAYMPSEEARNRVQRMFEASDAILDRVLLMADRCKSAYELRAAAAALRDIKEIQMIRTALDEEEQIARIRKLKSDIRQQEQTTQAEPVEIVFVGRTKEAAQ